MQSHRYIEHDGNVRRAPNWTKGKVFVFFSGVFVGIVLVSLIVVNINVGIYIQQYLLPKYQSELLQQHQVTSRQGQQKKRLRDEETASSEIRHGNPIKIIGKETKKGETRFFETLEITSPSSLSLSSNKKHSNESSSLLGNLKEPSFYELARNTGTDKVKGVSYLPSCLEDDSTCTRPSCERERCRPWGHFYHTMYQQKLRKFLDPNESLQMLEVGYVRIQSQVAY